MLAFFALAIIIALAIAFSMVCAAALVGLNAAVFLDTPFDEGWHAAWNRPWMLALFALVVIPFLAFGNR